MNPGCMGSAVITISGSGSGSSIIMSFNRVATSITVFQCADAAMQSKVVERRCEWSLVLERSSASSGSEVLN